MTGSELAEARRLLGYTQGQLAKALGVSVNTIARYEMPSNNGRYPVPHWVMLVVGLWLAQPKGKVDEPQPSQPL